MIDLLAKILLCVVLVIFILGGIAWIIMFVRVLRDEIELDRRIRGNSFDRKRS